jgi:uncharacterized protein YjbI with pentapeptide repeats
LKGAGSSVYFADFTDAKLQGAPLSASDLAWATLCRTQMPDGKPPEGEDRDCRAQSDPGPPPVPNPYVIVNATLQHQQARAVIHATIRWSATAGMSAGDVRAVAIDGSTGIPTTVGSVSISRNLPATTKYDATITDPSLLAAMNRGNRVVLSATQHPPLPSRASDRTNRSYVTVRTVQPGPGRGRVGGRDCSNLALGPTAPLPGAYDFCDLPGAVLTQAALSGPMREADLTGAELGHAGLNGIVFDGSAMGGVVASGAAFNGVSIIAASAPRLTMLTTLIGGAKLRASRLDDANFNGSTISDTTFAAASLRSAVFTGSTFDKVDLGFARLPKASLERVDALSHDRQQGRRSSLFLADLTEATLKDSK